MNKEFIITEDGSHTIYLPEIDEHYHSIHGAIQESLHVYIEAGLIYSKKKDLNILEIGFGTGLNAFLTYCYALKDNISVNYFSIEKFPLKESEYSTLNYPKNIFSENEPIFQKMHSTDWDTAVNISKKFTLHKLNVDLLDYNFDGTPLFDLVYYDAFAPDKQPEMWSTEILQEVASKVGTGGILVTYCAKGVVRRAFTAAGFQMERISGPIGKKEILRGKKTI